MNQRGTLSSDPGGHTDLCKHKSSVELVEDEAISDGVDGGGATAEVACEEAAMFIRSSQTLAGVFEAPPTVAGLLGRGVHHLPPVKFRRQVLALDEDLVPAVVVPDKSKDQSDAQSTAAGSSWFPWRHCVNKGPVNVALAPAVFVLCLLVCEETQRSKVADVRAQKIKAMMW